MARLQEIAQCRRKGGPVRLAWTGITFVTNLEKLDIKSAAMVSVMLAQSAGASVSAACRNILHDMDVIRSFGSELVIVGVGNGMIRPSGLTSLQAMCQGVYIVVQKVLGAGSIACFTPLKNRLRKGKADKEIV